MSLCVHCLSCWTRVSSSIKNDCLSFTMGISWEKICKAPSTMPDKLYVLNLIVAVIFYLPVRKNAGFSGVKNLPANADPLEEGMATHSSILAWRIPWTGDPGGLQSMGSQSVGYSWASTCTLRKAAHVEWVWEIFFSVLEIHSIFILKRR